MNNFHINSIRTVDEIIEIMANRQAFDKQYMKEVQKTEFIYSIQLASKDFNLIVKLNEYQVLNVEETSVSIRNTDTLEEQVVFLFDLDNTSLSKLKLENEIFFTKYENLDFYLNKIIHNHYSRLLKAKANYEYIINSLNKDIGHEFFVQSNLHMVIAELEEDESEVPEDYRHMIFTIFKTDEDRIFDLRRVNIKREDLDELSTKLNSESYEFLFETIKELNFSALVPINEDFKELNTQYFDKGRELISGYVKKEMASLNLIIQELIDKEPVEFLEFRKGGN